MSNFKVITFDVEHGNCHVLITPNNQMLMVDAGDKADFSPAKYLHDNYGINRLRWLTITHHDSDHMSDIENIDS